MNTDQNYLGKGDYANDSEQSANTAPSITSTADNQPNLTQQVKVNRQVYEAQKKLLALVEDFIDCHGVSSPVEVVNDLLFRWLTLPSTDLALDTNRTQLLVAQQIINFLTELSESAAKLEQMANCNPK
ncbi:hypothetical protein [Spirosoma linguale]|uniref:Uncharacterized protein n=1 Tax=Spirosoma linguale (strain ATCC 33905 / DSM 74 / LMG 10896 / Claus 1) TaxID=504472 RepID=D2QEV0_SPILD|nr:hypothetical protein Slin_5325 [Spirosoma linguale DSM 74]